MKYSVKDVITSRVILRDATPTEIAQAIGVPKINISAYINSNKLYMGRYKFFHVQEEPAPKKEFDGKTKFAKEWLEMQELFKDVKWAKEWEPGVHVVNED